MYSSQYDAMQTLLSIYVNTIILLVYIHSDFFFIKGFIDKGKNMGLSITATVSNSLNIRLLDRRATVSLVQNTFNLRRLIFVAQFKQNFSKDYFAALNLRYITNKTYLSISNTMKQTPKQS
mgnify:CR=1 FL=1